MRLSLLDTSLQRPPVLTRREPAGSVRRRTMILLVLATVIGSTGLAAGGTAGVLLGARLTGNDAAAGLPVGLLVIGTGAGALLIARGTGRFGRGRSLAFGYLLGALGAVLVILAAGAGSVGLFLVGSTVLGAANAAIFLTRYAAVAVAGGPARGSAIGAILFATAAGAVASPLLLGPSDDLAATAGLPPLTGLYLIAALAFGLAAVLLAAATRSGLAVTGALLGPAARTPVTGGDIAAGLRDGRVKTAIAILAATNLVMVAVMATVPVHLTATGHPLAVVGLIIGIHVAGMFAPSPVSGWLADRLGAATLATAGIGLLAVAGLAGVVVDQHSTPAVALFLATLGIGWNGGVIGGSMLLAESVPPRLRPDVEGLGEVAMSLAAALGAPLAGIAVALAGFPLISLLGAAVAIVTLAVLRSVAR